MIEHKSCILWEVNGVHSFVASDWTESKGCYFCTPAGLLVCYYLAHSMLVEGLILCCCAFSFLWTSILPDSQAHPRQKYIRGWVLSSSWKWHSDILPPLPNFYRGQKSEILSLFLTSVTFELFHLEMEQLVWANLSSTIGQMSWNLVQFRPHSSYICLGEGVHLEMGWENL